MYHTQDWSAYQTTPELVAAAKEAFPHIDLQFGNTVNVEYARQIIQELEVLQRFYPKTAAKIESIGPGALPKAAMSAGERRTGKFYLEYNAVRAMVSPEILNKQKQSFFEQGFLTGSTFRETVRHEMFHFVHHQIAAESSIELRRVNTLLEKAYHDAQVYEVQHGKPLFSRYALKVKEGSNKFRYTELHSEMGVLMWRGSQESHVRELRKIHNELRKRGLL